MVVFELRVDVLEAGEIEEVFFFKVDALHFLVAFYEFRLDVYGLFRNYVLFNCLESAESAQFLSHGVEVLIKIDSVPALALAILLQVPQFLLEEVGGELVEGTIDVVGCYFIHVGSGGLGDQFVYMGSVGLIRLGWGSALLVGSVVRTLLLLHVNYMNGRK